MSFDLKGALASLAPTIATMLAGPMAGVGVTELEKCFGLTPGVDATLAQRQDSITQVVQNGAMTPEVIAAVRAADQKHAELLGQQSIDLVKLNNDFATSQDKIAADDRNSARGANVQGGVQHHLFWLSLLLLVVTLGAEVVVLFNGYPLTIPEIVVGRVLGLMDSVALMVLSYWYGTSNGSAQKTTLLAAANPEKK